MANIRETIKIPRRHASFAMFAMVGFFLLDDGLRILRPELPTAPLVEQQTFSNLETVSQKNTASETNSFHIATPEQVNAIYISGSTAGSLRGINRIFSMLDMLPINSLVIDIKDATGRLSYQPLDMELEELGVGTNRIRNLASLIEELHRRRIYVIGRISVFQDPFFAEKFPEESFKDARTGELWRDYKGLAYLRPNSQKTWEYTVKIARDAYTQGFDEINLDYVRFPSDGDLFAMEHRPRSGVERSQALRSFFMHVDTELRQKDRIPISADLFGLTMSSKSDIGIGQILEDIAPHVDYIAPMVYPSHFAAGSYGIVLPATKPYETISRSLDDGLKRLAALEIPKERLRPWLQDFNLGAEYTPAFIGDQIRAAEELGIKSWMFWDPKNSYVSTKTFLSESEVIKDISSEPEIIDQLLY